ncbi:MAG: UDP-3-O-(3-hydroxymyristoyl)glucosamine N-acyltransferase [Bacteroidetes bacterium]|nr:UDP-3-O-(3-hydroxymyristoyl)glucosamine N-acyltransferase [Bacteroidota bacterium]
MELTARQIAELFRGEIIGTPEATVERLSKIEDGEPGTLSFLSNTRYASFLYRSDASVVLVNRDFIPEQEIKPTIIKVDDAYRCFATLLEKYNGNGNHNGKAGIEQPCHISASARIGKNLYAGAFTYIGNNVVIGNNVKLYPQVYIGDNVEIDDNSILYAGVKVYHDCKIGAHCTLHSGAVIGADGFGFFPEKNNEYKKVVQTGNVVLEDHVEVGANTTIDRATLGSTVIRRGVKLDNLIQVAHNVEIGDNTVIAAQTGIAGSTKLGKECMIGGQAGIIGHLNIADRVKIAAQSGIGSSIEEPGSVVQGSPAFNVGEYRRSYVIFRNLSELQKSVNSILKKLGMNGKE